MITTPKGYQYPEEADAVTNYPAAAAVTGILLEARPGISAVTTAARNTYAGADLWDGRIIWNTSTQRLEKYDLGTTTWITAVNITMATTVDGPDAFGDGSVVGISALMARADHKHGLPVVNALAINGVLTSALETAYITAIALAATQEIDVTTNSTFIIVTVNAINNWVFNVRSTTTATLNSLLAIGQSVTITTLVKQGATPYYCTGIQVDGTTQTVNWQGGVAPAAGFASGIDAYTIQITKTAASTYVVLASLTQF